MKKIELTKGKIALVDDEDFDKINAHLWSVSNTGYAVRMGRSGRKRFTILMHREILNAPRGMDVDHKDGNRLNNQSANIRLATRADNARNARKSSGSKSGFRGVYKEKGTSKFVARISHNWKRIHIGTFETKILAALAYDRRAIELHGAFASLNFEPVPYPWIDPETWRSL